MGYIVRAMAGATDDHHGHAADPERHVDRVSRDQGFEPEGHADHLRHGDGGDPEPQAGHAHHAGHAPQSGADLTRTAVAATIHCLTGCAIGEVLGMVLATALGWGDALSIAASITLAFVFGYGLTMLPLFRAGMPKRQVLRLALAADTFSIATMEVVDSAIIVLVPGAMAAGLGDPLFWGSLAFALLVAFFAAVPVNRWLIGRGKGHAVVHAYH